MARNIIVEEAAQWTAEETKENLAYLEVRCRWPEIERINELRRDLPADEPPVETPVEEVPTPEGVNESADVPKKTKPKATKKKTSDE